MSIKQIVNQKTGILSKLQDNCKKNMTLQNQMTSEKLFKREK